jgi:hypothetical protein
MLMILTAALAHSQTCSTSSSGGDMGAQVNHCVSTLGSLGGTITIPAGTFSINTQILLGSNITLQGAGANSTILNAGSSLGAKQIIRIMGAASAPVTNVRVTALQVQNGAPVAADPAGGMDGIRADYCRNCTFQNLNVNSIQGYYGIVVKYCSYCYILSNIVTNFSYAGIAGGTGGDHIYILNNTVSNAAAASGLAYGIIASDYESYRDANYNTYVWVDGNSVSNVPTWECYDSHGGQHQWFTNNTCSNAAYGIDAGLAVYGAANPIADDLHILWNTFTSSVYSTANPNYGNRSCIALSSDSAMIPVTHVDVEWNTCNGFGSTSAGTVSGNETGGIYSKRVQYFKYENNTCNSWNQSCFNIWFLNQHGTIKNNIAHDMLSAYDSASSQIEFVSIGNYDIAISGNQLNPSSSAFAPKYQLYQFNEQNQISLGAENTYTYVQTSQYISRYTIPYNVTDPTSTVLIGQYGDAIYDTSEAAFWTVTAPLFGYGSEDTTNVEATGNMTAGQTTITNLAGSSYCGGAPFWYYCLPEGMNITIAGAGPEGVDLNARILTLADSTGSATVPDTIVLNTPALTSVTGANIKYQSMTATHSGTIIF